MPNKLKISVAGNVEVPAYLVLRAKEYEITVDRRAKGEETWYAEKNGRQFSADGPFELLGLVAVLEARGDDWSGTDEEIDAFFKRYDI